jgi:membrane-associated phospholipid phosphatase
MKKAVINGFLKLTDCLSTSRTALILFTEVFMGVISSVSLAVLFVSLTTEIFEMDTQFIDTTVSRLIYSLRTPPLTAFMLFITDLGADYILVGLVAIIIFLIWKRHRKEALLFLIITAMGVFINSTLKILIQRPRPLISPMISASSYSFPSGHAMNSFVFYAFLSFYIFHFTRRKLLSSIVSILCAVLILLIGFSRIYLGVHYPSDILAGYLVGFWWFVTALAIEKTITFLKLFREMES